MEKGTTFVAIDDSKRKMVVGILRPEATEPEQREMPKEPPLIRRLFQRLVREGPVQACYEAGVSGYDLHRQITACGVSCQVMAPALTPRRPGQPHQNRSAGRRQAGPAVPRRRADPDPRAERGRGSGARSPALPGRGAPRCRAVAASAAAWRAQQRLHRRYRHLVGHGKRPPVAVVAVARELVGFVWAAMTQPRVAA
jgi:hypothetical protein